MEELSGNVWEWTSSAWGKNWEEPDFAYPYDRRDGREEKAREILRVGRGGSFFRGNRHVRSAARSRSNPELRLDGLGFRVGLFPLSLDSASSDS